MGALIVSAGVLAAVGWLAWEAAAATPSFRRTRLRLAGYAIMASVVAGTWKAGWGPLFDSLANGLHWMPDVLAHALVSVLGSLAVVAAIVGVPALMEREFGRIQANWAAAEASTEFELLPGVPNAFAADAGIAELQRHAATPPTPPASPDPTEKTQ